MLASKLLCLQIACLAIGLATGNEKYFIVNAPISTTPPVPTLPSGYIHHSDLKTAYKIYTDRLNWTSAQEACSSEGARLAVIDTQPKLECIKNMRPWRNWVWTGIYRQSWTKDWRTVHGGPISSDLPQLHSTPFTYGDCVAVSGESSLTRLSLMSCAATRRYVCEIPDAE